MAFVNEAIIRKKYNCGNSESSLVMDQAPETWVLVIGSAIEKWQVEQGFSSIFNFVSVAIFDNFSKWSIPKEGASEL